MIAKNEHTGAFLQSKAATAEYQQNFAQIDWNVKSAAPAAANMSNEERYGAKLADYGRMVQTGDPALCDQLEPLYPESVAIIRKKFAAK